MHLVLCYGDNTMTSKDIFKDAFPQDKQIGGNHYQHYLIQPYEFISKNELTFFQGNVIKYVIRYPYNYNASLYAFSNKKKLAKIIETKHICEPRL